MRRSLRWLLPLALAGVIVQAAHAQAPVPATTLHYPRPDGRPDSSIDYSVTLLKLALQKAGAHYVLVPTAMQMEQRRAVHELATDGGRVDVLSSMSSKDREEELLAVRIPISKGLIGWRIALLPFDQRDSFRDITGLDGLRALQGGQVAEWPDTRILLNSGLPLEQVPTYGSLFSMLAAKRIDYVPRAITEVGDEAAAHPELAIDPYLLLRYPAADYFFVNRKNVRLAEDIRRGLEIAIADGSFDRLFYERFGKWIRQARLDRRRIIELPNPLLTPETPLLRKELWFNMDDLKRHPLPGRP
jgi:hypothetical protein